jgi:hypothetical protein
MGVAGREQAKGRLAGRLPDQMVAVALDLDLRYARYRPR